MPLFTSEYVFSDDYPTIEPSLKLDFANARALDPRITFTRASTATYVGANGLIKTAGADEARFDHDPSTGESLGLLIEESRTNILPYSEDFSQSAWVTFGTASKSSNVATAPDGNFTADSITIPAASGVLDNILISVNTTYTFSAYIRGTPGTTIRILSNANSSGIVTNIVTVSEIWQRYSVTFTTNSGDNNTSIQFDSGGGNTFYVWGAQVEAGSFPTSYIPTNGPTSGSTVTRAVDNAFITGKNFSSWYNQSEGTVRILAKTNRVYSGSNAFPYSMQIDDGTASNRIAVDNGVLSSTIRQKLSVFENGSAVGDNLGNLQNVNGLSCAFAYKINDLAFVNGAGTLFTSNNAPIPTTMNRLQIGSGTGGILTGHISQLTYYPKRLANAQLQTLTQ
jgi:hypothetical protein